MADDLNPKDAAALSRAPLHLFPAVGVIHAAMACRDGAIVKGYGAYNWRDKPISLMEYLSAMTRHIKRIQDGEWVDKSGATHLGHVIATAGIILDAQACGTLIDDRPEVDGTASELLTEIEDCLKGHGVWGAEDIKDGA